MKKLTKKLHFPTFFTNFDQKRVCLPFKKIEFLCNHFINLNESKFMLSKLNSISLIRKFGPIYWSNREAINLQREVRLFSGRRKHFLCSLWLKFIWQGFLNKNVHYLCYLHTLFLPFWNSIRAPEVRYRQQMYSKLLNLAVAL